MSSKDHKQEVQPKIGQAKEQPEAQLNQFTQPQEFSFSKDPEQQPASQQRLIKKQQVVPQKVKKQQQQYSSRTSKDRKYQGASYSRFYRYQPYAQQSSIEMQQKPSSNRNQSKRIKYQKIQGAKLHTTCQKYLIEKRQQYKTQDQKKEIQKYRQEPSSKQVSPFDITLNITFQENLSSSREEQKLPKKNQRYFDSNQKDIDIYQNQEQESSTPKQKTKICITVCYRCGQPGHFSKNCLMDKIQRCRYCLRNHNKDQCPSQKVNNVHQGTIRQGMKQFQLLFKKKFKNQWQKTQFQNRFPEYDLTEQCEVYKSEEKQKCQYQAIKKLEPKKNDKQSRIFIMQQSESNSDSNFVFDNGTLALWNWNCPK